MNYNSEKAGHPDQYVRGQEREIGFYAPNNGPVSINQTTPNYPLKTVSTIRLSWCELLTKSKPQYNSVLGGMLLYMVSGLHIAWGIWRTQFYWIFTAQPGAIIFLLLSFYLAAIIGSQFGGWIVNRWSKKSIYYLGGVSMLLGNILFTAVPEYYAALVIGRLLIGFAYSFIYITVTIHSAENADKRIRGYVLTFGNYILMGGMLLTVVFAMVPLFPEFNLDRAVGTVGIIFSSIALLLTSCVTYESVVFLIKENRDQEAIGNMIKLRCESVETWAIRNEFNELKLMVEEDQQLTCDPYGEGNVRPILIVLINRILHVLTNNMPLNFMIIVLTTTIPWIPGFDAYVLVAARFVFAAFPPFMVDRLGRKGHTTISSGLCGGLLFILAIILATYSLTYNVYWLPTAFFIVFQLVAALGLDPISHVYVGEAFPTTKKSWSLATVTAIENLIHLILIAVFFNMSAYLTDNGIIAFLFVISILILGLTVALHILLPETKGMSLRQCRDAFNKNLPIKRNTDI